jgi:hypothetical protein
MRYENNQTACTRYVLVLRTGMRLEKSVLLASSTYFYHESCTQYVLSTYGFEKYVLGTYLG